METERLEAERLEAERLEAERVAADEAARLEAERIAAEDEAARLGAERVEAERLEAERIQAERMAEEDAARFAAELDAARIEAEHEASVIAAEEEAARLAADEALRAEAEETARADAERAAIEAERIEAERLLAEQAELEAAQAVPDIDDDALVPEIHLDLGNYEQSASNMLTQLNADASTAVAQAIRAEDAAARTDDSTDEPAEPAEQAAAEVPAQSTQTDTAALLRELSGLFASGNEDAKPAKLPRRQHRRSRPAVRPPGPGTTARRRSAGSSGASLSTSRTRWQARTSQRGVARSLYASRRPSRAERQCQR